MLEGDLDHIGTFDGLGCQVPLELIDCRVELRDPPEGGKGGIEVLGSQGGKDLLDDVPVREDLDLGVEELFLAYGHRCRPSFSHFRGIEVLSAELD
jgi:hypothetical protein